MSLFNDYEWLSVLPLQWNLLLHYHVICSIHLTFVWMYVHYEFCFFKQFFFFDAEMKITRELSFLIYVTCKYFKENVVRSLLSLILKHGTYSNFLKIHKVWNTLIPYYIKLIHILYLIFAIEELNVLWLLIRNFYKYKLLL